MYTGVKKNERSRYFHRDDEHAEDDIRLCADTAKLHNFFFFRGYVHHLDCMAQFAFLSGVWKRGSIDWNVHHASKCCEELENESESITAGCAMAVEQDVISNSMLWGM